jgi:hypothetical protein
MAVSRNGGYQLQMTGGFMSSPATNSKSQKLLKVSLIILRQHATANKSTLYIMARSSFKNPDF